MTNEGKIRARRKLASEKCKIALEKMIRLQGKFEILNLILGQNFRGIQKIPSRAGNISKKPQKIRR